MIEWILLKVVFACPTIQVFNQTEEWTHFDQRTYQYAQRRCGELYLDAPCLTRFWKKGKMEYAAACGQKEVQ